MIIPPFRPYEFGKDDQSPIFSDPDTKETWYLKPGEINYLEKWVGFCPTCKGAYTSRWEVSIPNNKIFLGTRCISYWKSINKNNPMNVEIKHCGHDENKGWISRYIASQEKERDTWVKEVTDESLKMMRESFEANPNLLSHPVPEGIVEMFKNKPSIPCAAGTTMRFTRPSREDKIKWANQHVERLKKDLRDALHELERLENE